MSDLNDFNKITSLASEDGISLSKKSLEVDLYFNDADSYQHKCTQKYLDKNSLGLLYWDNNYATYNYNILIDSIRKLMNYKRGDDYGYDGLAFMRKEFMDVLRSYFGSKAFEEDEILYFSNVFNNQSGPTVWSKVILYHSKYFDNFFKLNDTADIIIPKTSITAMGPPEESYICLPESKFVKLELSKKTINIPLENFSLKSYCVYERETDIKSLSNNHLVN